MAPKSLETTPISGTCPRTLRISACVSSHLPGGLQRFGWSAFYPHDLLRRNGLILAVETRICIEVQGLVVRSAVSSEAVSGSIPSAKSEA